MISGKTRVRLKDRFVAIEELAGQEVAIWNGSEYRKTKIREAKCRNAVELTMNGGVHIIVGSTQEFVILKKDFKYGVPKKDGFIRVDITREFCYPEPVSIIYNFDIVMDRKKVECEKMYTFNNDIICNSMYLKGGKNG